MAKVMVSMPDELLARLDAEAARRGTTRSGLLQAATRREIGDLAFPRHEIVERLDRVAAGWDRSVDVVAELRADRTR
jgi:predicted transcriptional regulator